MAIVFRVEAGASGKGPYTFSSKLKQWLRDPSFLAQTQTPDPFSGRYADTELAHKLHFLKWQSIRYGFANLEQYKSWFHTFQSRDLLAKNGFILVAHDFPNTDVTFSAYQVAFRNNAYSTIIGRWNCKTLEYISANELHIYQNIPSQHEKLTAC